MNRVALVHDSKLDDPGNVQISAQRAFVLTDQVRLVRCRTESRIGILIGIDRDRLQSEIVTGAEDAHRDLTAVCNQDFFKFRHSSLLINKYYYIRHRRPGQTQMHIPFCDACSR